MAVAPDRVHGVPRRGRTHLIQWEREPEIEESRRLQAAVAQLPPPARSALLRATVLPLLRRMGAVKRTFLRAKISLRHGVVPVQFLPTADGPPSP